MCMCGGIGMSWRMGVRALPGGVHAGYMVL